MSREAMERLGAKLLPVVHDPRWRYDCDRCKFSWCCGPCCACLHARTDRDTPRLPDPPLKRRRQIDEARIANGYGQEFMTIRRKT